MGIGLRQTIALRLNRFLRYLRFHDELEASFLEDYHTKSIFQIRVAIVFTIIAYASLHVLDYWLVPEITGSTLIIRYLFVIPILTVILVLSYYDHFKSYKQLYLSFGGVTAGLGPILVMAIAGPDVTSHYFVVLIVITMALFSLVKLRFFCATASALVVFSAYIFMIVYTDQAYQVEVISNIIMLVVAILVGMVSSYFIEVHLRREYLLARELEYRTIEVEAANKELQKISTIDSMTGVANRRGFDEFVKREWKRAAREKKQLSIIMADLDFFKAYNDRYGHQAGDNCLRRVAESLVETASRPGDLVARYGGEEFVIVLSDTSSEHAGALAAKALKAVESMKVKHTDSLTSKYVTISLGVATMMPDQDIPPESLLEAADNALYMAKGNGRNCVKISGQWQKERSPLTPERT